MWLFRGPKPDLNKSRLDERLLGGSAGRPWIVATLAILACLGLWLGRDRTNTSFSTFTSEAAGYSSTPHSQTHITPTAIATISFAKKRIPLEVYDRADRIWISADYALDPSEVTQLLDSLSNPEIDAEYYSTLTSLAQLSALPGYAGPYGYVLNVIPLFNASVPNVNVRALIAAAHQSASTYGPNATTLDLYGELCRHPGLIGTDLCADIPKANGQMFTTTQSMWSRLNGFRPES